jgi:two-component system cell cycle sensor histidine kinase/response regulator CckA
VSGKITRRTSSAEGERARFLRKALQESAPSLSVFSENATVKAPVNGSISPESPDLQSAYLKQLIECAPEAISILDTDLRIVRLNGEFTRIFGYSAEEALGQRIESLIVPPDRNAETRWIQDALAQGRKVVVETKRQHKDGSLVDVLISSAPVIMSGKHVGVCALYRDISEQKRAEALSSALLNIAEKANSAGDLQQFYGAIHNTVAELIYARNFYIALYDRDAQLLTFPYFVDEADPTPTPKKLGKGLTEYVLRTGEPLLCTPEVFEKLVARKEVELIGAPSLDWLGVPLKVGNTAVGVVVVQSYSGNVRFGERSRAQT